LYIQETFVSHLFQVALTDFAIFLSFLFLLGCAGCVIVLFMSFFEDARVILGFEDVKPTAPRDSSPVSGTVVLSH